MIFIESPCLHSNLWLISICVGVYFSRLASAFCFAFGEGAGFRTFSLSFIDLFSIVAAIIIIIITMITLLGI